MWGYIGRHMRRAVFSAVVLSGAVGGIAYATIPDSGGVIHGCYQKNVGTLRVIDPSAGDSCGSSEIPISWSQTGPAGPQGAPGAAGQNGAPGANGKDGVSPTVTQLAPGDTHCAGGGAAITDATGSTAYVCNGTNGKDGQPFSGTFTSPNGEFSIAVKDSGITLTSPTASITVTAGGVGLTGTTLGVTSASTLNLTAPFIGLNPSGCQPAVRETDLLTATAPPFGGPVFGFGPGSGTVCIGQ